jgi:ribosomal protein S18 acetylase RimI-like enzyme
MTLIYREAEKRDCLKLTELRNIASDGIMEHLLHDLIPGMTPVQVAAYDMEKDKDPHTYRNAIVVTEETDVVGMAFSYPSYYHKITDKMRKFFPADRLEHLNDFFSSRVENSWYLDALGVFQSHRRRGIGERLISLTKKRAVEHGYSVLSLIARADNELALPLYKRTGFEIVKKIELRPNEFIRHDQGCVLMRCQLAV